jgi:hypothetical protein
MFESGWKEALEKKMFLDDDNPDSFDVLLL